MKKLLFVDCCIRREMSRTRRIADAFLSAIAERGEYEISKLCLMDENLACFSDGFFLQRERLLTEHAFDHPRFRYAHEFQSADRIVIAAPFWDLSFPALLKVYLENLCVEGITFGCNEKGCYGTCQAEKLVFITTRGGIFRDSPMEMGARYLKAMCTFFGIESFTCIAAEGLDIGLRSADTIVEEAIEHARNTARTF